ncbi:MAG: type I-E CRISPR-associated protein Cse2/CasB [Kiritimatiellae bacterium]|nr:type I-E CRISPR-associated protein Cse2/CasB [Kiritimatiellia bacterium]MCO5068863.1 type I-E CRISPR-associated protein Cse2/CasB [Kiritimatiellia bacterium]
MSKFPPSHALAKPFVEYLDRYKNDRGALAHLRGGLSDNLRPRTWPLLGGFSGKSIIGDRRFEIVAALWAYSPELDVDEVNLGETIRAMTGKGGEGSMDIRFRRLLSCSHEEITERVVPLVRMAQAKDVRIGYARLLSDLLWWGENVRIAWARSYWRVQAPDELEEAT